MAKKKAARNLDDEINGVLDDVTKDFRSKKAGKVPPGQLGDWQDEVPDEIQRLADAYDAAHTVKSKAVAKLNAAKESLIDSMKEHGVQRVRIRNGDKFLELGATDKVSYKKPKSKPGEDDE